jgi:hypothetical protein
LFYDVTDEFTLCNVRASNAEGVIRFGGGMLSQIRLTPKVAVLNPKSFHLQDVAIDHINVPPVVLPHMATGWVAHLEASGLLRRYGKPRDTVILPTDSPAWRHYLELFAQCADAAFVLNSELFYFRPPADTSIGGGHLNDTWLPILDLRELGGLAITTAKNGGNEVSLVEDGDIVWSERDLVAAIKRLYAEFRE